MDIKPRIMKTICVFFACLLATAMYAQEKEFAAYSVGVGFSPFGPSLNAGYNLSQKTSFNVGLGFLPSSETPAAFVPEIDGQTYTATGTSSWMGFFLRHRPFENQNIGFNVGLAVGQIENELVKRDEANNIVDCWVLTYNSNPVTYFGLSYGAKPVKGFQFGVDLGVLSTGGPSIENPITEFDPNTEANLYEARRDEVKSKAGWSMLPNLQVTASYGF